MSRGIAVRSCIVLARLERRLGWPGLLGLALAAGAGLWLADAHPRFAAQDDAAPPAASAPTTIESRAPLTAPTLPPTTDVPLLLTRIERAAVDQGLGWPKADYVLTAATEDTPASVDVRCVLKGPYPAIRRFVTTLLQDAPTLTLRELGLVRQNSDAADVEAKLTLVVYLKAAFP